MCSWDIGKTSVVTVDLYARWSVVPRHMDMRHLAHRCALAWHLYLGYLAYQTSLTSRVPNSEFPIVFRRLLYM